MRKILNSWLLAGLCLAGFSVLSGCGSGSGGGGGNGGGSNSGPTPLADQFVWTGNTRLTVFGPNGLLANDPPGTVIASADSGTSLGGTVVVNLANGAFIYNPPVGLQNADDSFSYTVSGGASATVTISLDERIWWVRNNDTGADQGNDQAPFLTLAQAETASDENDTIFVFAGDQTAAGQDGGITLKNGQRLIGEGVGIRVNGFPLVDPLPRSALSNSGLAAAPGDSPVVLLASNNEVAGFTIDAAFNEGILALGGAGHNLHDNAISVDPLNGREGIRLLNLTGENVVGDNGISGTPGDGIRFSNREDRAGNPVAATPVSAKFDVGENTLDSCAGSGIAFDFSGAGTQVELQVIGNFVSAAGSGGTAAGISLSGLGSAQYSAVVSRNSVVNSSDVGIGLNLDDSSTLNSLVANNNLLGNGGVSDFQAALANNSTATTCIELRNNANGGASSTFSVANDSGIAGAFEFFEEANDTLAIRTEPVSAVVLGACAAPLDGAQLFEFTCGRCHSGNGRGNGTVGGTITNQTVPNILFQLANNPVMGFIRLTQEEIEAIAGFLSVAP